MMTHVVADGLTQRKRSSRKTDAWKSATPKKTGKAVTAATSKNQTEIPGRAPARRPRAQSK
jgi:hypothetical protein